MGEGIAGLSAAFYLKDYAHITVFSHGNGASVASAGMMHKFVGDTGDKSVYGDEAFEASRLILEALEGDFYKKTPIIRQVLSPEMKQNFLQYAHSDLTFLNDDQVEIHEGYLIDVPQYLKILKTLLISHNVEFVDKFIGPQENFSLFDRVILCAGYGIKQLCPHLKMKFLKGQAFSYKNLHKHTLPLIAKGYLAPFSDKVVIGATYEKHFDTVKPDIKVAVELLKDAIETYFKPYDEQLPYEVLAGVRVFHPNFNHPKIINKDDKTFIVTGLGSRGLLYHGLLGKILYDIIISKKTGSNVLSFFRINKNIQ